MGRRYLQLCAAVRCDAHPKIRKSQRPHGVFRLLHGAQVFRAKDGSRRNAGGKTGISGLVPGEQARILGILPQGLLGDPAQAKGRDHTKLAQCPHARAVIRVVRSVGAVHHQVKIIRGGCGANAGEQCVFAVVAAVSRVLAHGFHIQDVRVQDLQFCAQLTGQALRVLRFKGGLKGSFGVIGFHLRAGLNGGVKQIRRVHTAGKGNGGFGVRLPKLGQIHGDLHGARFLQYYSISGVSYQ